MARPRPRLTLLVCVLLALAAPAAARGAVVVGISDQQASTFSNPLYGPLKLKVTRYVTPYDVMSDPVRRTALAEWLNAARSSGQEVLVAFEHSYIRSKAKKAPSVAQYTTALKAFKKKYPWVKSIQPWNEANRCQRVQPDGTVVGQPICHNPKRAAEYYEATRKVFPSAKITALDILDQNSVKSSVKYVKDFLKYVKTKPKYWGIHNYSDTNRFSQSRTKALLTATRSGEVWLTETGGIVRFPPNFDEDAARAAKSLGCMFTIAKAYARIKRLYIYQFNGAPPEADFDAGLVDVDGKRRPGYSVVKSRKRAKCHA